VNTRIEEYMYKSNFDPCSGQGQVIANTSIVDKADAEEVLDMLGRAFDQGYTISRRVLILDEGDAISTLEVPAGSLGLATVCSITMDGILMKKGIAVLTSFAGLAKIKEKQPIEFTDLIAYAGSSLDPVKVFMGRKVTSVANAIRLGSGRVLANVREIPVAAAGHALELLEASRSAGFGGLIKVGGPAEPILGCPVAAGKIGIAFYAGVNGTVAAEEMGARMKTLPISMLVDYSRMTDLDRP
jgi:repressor of nif and glnA expression